jgi:geranylgeranyl pyrophosphate synthase
VKLTPKEWQDQFEEALSQTFNGSAKELHSWGLSHVDDDLAQLIAQAMRTSGKRFRPQLLQAWYNAIGGTKEVTDACLLVELLHTATLVIDDIQDHSPLRRGQPTLHTRQGEPVAISIGLLMLFMAVEKAHKIHPEVGKLVGEYMNQLAIGQAHDVLWQHTRAVDTPMQLYERMAMQKTAALFVLCIRVAEILAGKEHDTQVEHIIQDLGILYQLCDDLADLKGQAGKEVAEDVRERKVNAVLITAAETKEKELLAAYNEQPYSPTNTLAIIAKAHAPETLRKAITHKAAALRTRIQSTPEPQKAILEACFSILSL